MKATSDGSDVETLRDQSWRALRRMRSMPPGCAAKSSARAETFRTALEQAEQYFRAAETVGYEVKPVLVFYGLYQAARAVAAASPVLSDDDWRLRGHGMSVMATRDQTDLAKVVIKSENQPSAKSLKKLGAPQTVARALNSMFLPPKSTTALADLWPLIPEARHEPLPDADLLRRRALTCTSERSFGPPPGFGFAERGLDVVFEHWDGLLLAGLPHALADDQTLESITSFLSGYPSLSGVQPRRNSSNGPPPMEYLPAGPALKASFLVPAPRPHYNVDFQTAEMRYAIPYRGSRWVLPAVAGMDKPMHPLLAWWAVMLALSSLARYEPEAWAGMVNVDKADSPTVAIEYLLDTALDALPEVILDAMPDL